jgi:hypothetical protein
MISLARAHIRGYIEFSVDATFKMENERSIYSTAETLWDDQFTTGSQCLFAFRLILHRILVVALSLDRRHLFLGDRRMVINAGLPSIPDAYTTFTQQLFGSCTSEAALSLSDVLGEFQRHYFALIQGQLQRYFKTVFVVFFYGKSNLLNHFSKFTHSPIATNDESHSLNSDEK